MRLSQVIELSSGLAAIFFNLILVPIILTRSSARIGKYKYFLLAYTLSASYFSLAEVLIIPTWYIPNNGFFFFSTLDYLPRWLQQIPVMSYPCTYAMNNIVLTWCFVYRLAVIGSPEPWILKRRYFPICLLLSILLNIWMIYSCVSIMPSPETELIFREELLNRTGLKLEEIGYIGGEITINGSINMGMVLCLGSFIVFLSTCIVIFTICWLKIGRRLAEMRRVGGCHSNYKFQHRLFVLLSLQTCMPIIFNMLPGVVCFILSLAKIQVGDFPYILSMIVTFAQIADPIFTVFFVSEYKAVFTRCLHRIFPKVAPSSRSGTGGHGTNPGQTAPPMLVL